MATLLVPTLQLLTLFFALLLEVQHALGGLGVIFIGFISLVLFCAIVSILISLQRMRRPIFAWVNLFANLSLFLFSIWIVKEVFFTPAFLFCFVVAGYGVIASIIRLGE